MIESSRLTPLIVASQGALAVLQETDKAQGQSWFESIRSGAYEHPVASDFAEEIARLRLACEAEWVDVQVVRDFLAEARVVLALLEQLETSRGESPRIIRENAIEYRPIDDLRRAIYHTERDHERLSS
jgi:hypothetical protein